MLDPLFADYLSETDSNISAIIPVQEVNDIAMTSTSLDQDNDPTESTEWGNWKERRKVLFENSKSLKMHT